MRTHLFSLLYIGLTSAFTLSMASIQTTSWYHFFHHFPAPLLWFPIIIYISLYRKSLEGILLIYALGLFIITLTSMPLGVLFTLFLIIWTLIQLTKDRVFTPGPKYFLITTTISCITFQFLQILFSIWMENGPFWENLLFWERLVQIFLTSLIALPIYYALLWIDKVSKRQQLIKGIGKDFL